MADALPLPAGTLLAERFEILDEIGRGGLGIVYRAKDRQRGDVAAVKELAPPGSRRPSPARLELPDDPRLRDRFIEEARQVARLNLPGVLPVRAAFAENGTAYFVSEFVFDASSLQDWIRREGRLDADGALDVFYQLMETLEAVHAQGLLHRDVKPTNVLLTPAGRAYLIDFGAAREWHADSPTTHTVMFTPGYAPPEQLSERARRGPATDVYGLCATLFEMLAGQPPPAATDRMAGIDLPDLAALRPDVGPAVVRAVEYGLTLRFDARPQSIAELRDALGEPDEPTRAATLAQLDERLHQALRFAFERKACPACGGLLLEPKPARRETCPVCRTARIRRRPIADNLCPACALAPLRRFDNTDPLSVCPACRIGALQIRRKGLLGRVQVAVCADCSANFDLDDGSMADASGRRADFATWRDESGRAEAVWRCPSCRALFDEMPDGQIRPADPPKPTPAHTLLEWSRIAQGLAPDAGNAECDGCGAEFHLEAEAATLLKIVEDPHRFAAAYLGRRLPLEDLRWLAVGKTSCQPGLVCDACATEFDHEEGGLRLVATADRNLSSAADSVKSLEDWHRRARGVPEASQIEAFRLQIQEALAAAYVDGEFGFDGRPEWAWRGPARRDGAHDANLAITDSEWIHGGLLRKWRKPADALTDAWEDQGRLYARFEDEDGPTAFDIEPVELVAHLKSGEAVVALDAARIAARLRRSIEVRPNGA